MRLIVKKSKLKLTFLFVHANEHPLSRITNEITLDQKGRDVSILSYNFKLSDLICLVIFF